MANKLGALLHGLICLILLVAVVPTQSTSAGTKQEEDSVRPKERRSVCTGLITSNHNDDDSILLILNQHNHTIMEMIGNKVSC